MNAQRYGRLGLSIAAALLCGALAPTGFAQPAPGGETPAGPPLYRVEIIVFAYNQGDSSEEDFAHIARRESIEGSTGPGEIADFDFGPYVPEESLTNGPLGETAEAPAGETADAPGGASSLRSRLLLGGVYGAEGDASERNAASNAAEDSGAARPAGAALDPGVDAADPAASSSGPALPGSAEGPVDGGLANEAEDVIDPFGTDPGNAVAPFRFRLLAQDELTLTDLRRRLERVESVYTPLVHGGWIQEGLPPQQARPFDLAYLGASTPSGTIRLHVSRFLHLTLDLDYRAPWGSGIQQVEVPEEDVPSDAAFGVDQAPPVFGAARRTLSDLEVSRRFHLDAERRMRSGEVHYFDHPFFGVIAVVQPYEPPEPPTTTEGVRPAA